MPFLAEPIDYFNFLQLFYREVFLKRKNLRESLWQTRVIKFILQWLAR